ncbi:MAG: D-2-hydroxyacid dehydrogenase [Faecalibacterium sp.]|nr:D-2-hydroxyacid dehydrogenase [Faecalibacterium sp.]
MKAVVLESYALQEGDMHWEALRPLVDTLEIYPLTPPEKIAERLAGAELAILNKCRIGEEVLAACPALRWVGIIATGTDVVDLEACRRHGVLVANVPGYASYSVAQHAFSLLLAVCQCADRYARGVRAGYWKQQPAAYGILPMMELAGKTFGIYGYGDIGRQAARIAQGFGMHVLAATRTVRPEYAADGVEFVDLDTLLACCDVVSLHCPLTPQTKELIDAKRLARIKPGCILINTARGGLVNDAAVADACKSGRLAWYLADAASTEPIPRDNPLLTAENVLITPHISWATDAALRRLEAITAQNLKSYLEGYPEHIVNA